MASPAGRRRRPQGDQILVTTVVLLAVVVAGVVVIAVSRSFWGLALALVAAVLATAMMTLRLVEIVGDGSDAQATGPGRRRVLALGALAAAVLILAGTLAENVAAQQRTAPPDAATATQTLRDFLSVGVLENNPYTACEYLTPAEQQAVARLGSQGQSCRDVLTANPPRLGTVNSPGALQALRMHTALHAGVARITVSGAGTPTRTFVLHRTTPAERAPFAAPPADWRIAFGATALL
jgi:hypothetical protein